MQFDEPARRETFSTLLSLESTSSTSMVAVILTESSEL